MGQLARARGWDGYLDLGSKHSFVSNGPGSFVCPANAAALLGGGLPVTREGLRLDKRSAGQGLQYRQVPDRVPMVLPFLLKDHVQALQHSVVLVRVARGGGSNAGTLQLCFVHAGDRPGQPRPSAPGVGRGPGRASGQLPGRCPSGEGW